MDRNKIKEYYDHEIEANRLEQEWFKLEGIRTKEIIERYLHGNSLQILDIGIHILLLLQERNNKFIISL